MIHYRWFDVIIPNVFTERGGRVRGITVIVTETTPWFKVDYNAKLYANIPTYQTVTVCLI